MEQLKYIKEALISSLMPEVGNLAEADSKELGEVVDMIKDLAETEYYCTVTEAMTKKEKEGHYYTPIYDYTRYYDPYRDIDRDKGRMYYSDGNGSSSNGGSRSMYTVPAMKDYREGRSPMYRKMYMEAKEMKHGKEAQMKELDAYM